MTGGLTAGAVGGAPTGTEPSAHLMDTTAGGDVTTYAEPGTPAQPGPPIFENMLADTSVTTADIQTAAALIQVLLFASFLYIEVKR